MSFFSKFKIGNTSYDVKDALAGKTLSLSGADLSLVKADGTAASTVTLPVGGQPKVVKFNGTRFVMKADTSVNIESGVSVGDLIIIDCNENYIDMTQTGSSTNHLDLYCNLNKDASTPSTKNSYTDKINMTKYMYISKSLLAVVTSITSGIVFATVMSPPISRKPSIYIKNLGSAPTLDNMQNYLRSYGNVIKEYTNQYANLGVTIYDNRDSSNPVAITPLNKYGVFYDDMTFATIISYDSSYNEIAAKISVSNTFGSNYGIYKTIAGYNQNTSNRAVYPICKTYGDLITLSKLFNNYLYVFGELVPGYRFIS